MSETRAKAIRIASAVIAGLLLAALLAAILAFAFVQPVKAQGEIDPQSVAGDRPASYSVETRAYVAQRVSNWVARMLGVPSDAINLRPTTDRFLEALAMAGIPTDKVRGMADFLEAQDPSETLEHLILAFCHPAVDEAGNELSGQYVFDVNADPTPGLLALVGTDSVVEFFSYSLLTPDELGAVLYWCIYNGLSEQDAALLEQIGCDRFIHIFSGFVRIAGNLEGFMTGSSAQEARILAELVYTVSADYAQFVDVLGAETIERLFGVRRDAFPFTDNQGVGVEDAQVAHLNNLLDAGQGLVSFAAVALSAFLDQLTPDLFASYRDYTASGERADLLYAALLSARALLSAAQSAQQTEGCITLLEAVLALGRVTTEAEALGAGNPNAGRTLLQLSAALSDLVAAGEGVNSREDLDQESVFENLSTRFAYFEEIASVDDVREFTAVRVLFNLCGFRVITLLLGVI